MPNCIFSFLAIRSLPWHDGGGEEGGGGGKWGLCCRVANEKETILNYHVLHSNHLLDLSIYLCFKEKFVAYHRSTYLKKLCLS